MYVYSVMGNESCKYSVWKVITSYKTASFPVVLNQFLPDPVILEHILIAYSSSELATRYILHYSCSTHQQ